MATGNIIFEQIRSSGCLSYLLGCPEKKKCVVIDPELDKAEEYIELAKFFSSELLYAIDTHTHADHNSACKVLREKHGIKVIMHKRDRYTLYRRRGQRWRYHQFRRPISRSGIHSRAHFRCHVPVVPRPHFYRRYAPHRRLRQDRSTRR